MEPQFWHRVWQNNTIGFHQTGYHPWLAKIVERKSNNDLFVPLCGKSLDMWPLANHYRRLIGAELSDIACQDFFNDAGVVPRITRDGRHQTYHADTSDYDIKLWQGDYFGLTAAQVNSGESVDIFDRAALVALPESMRMPYVQQLRALCKHATLFLMTLEFDQRQMNGPPFSLDHTMIKNYFSYASSIEKIATQPLNDKIFAQRKLKVSELVESLYLIKW